MEEWDGCWWRWEVVFFAKGRITAARFNAFLDCQMILQAANGTFANRLALWLCFPSNFCNHRPSLGGLHCQAKSSTQTAKAELPPVLFPQQFLPALKRRQQKNGSPPPRSLSFPLPLTQLSSVMGTSLPPSPLNVSSFLWPFGGREGKEKRKKKGRETRVGGRKAPLFFSTPGGMEGEGEDGLSLPVPRAA